MSLLQGSLLFSGNATEKSLRLGGTRSLTRTMSATGSRRKATLSVWLKKTNVVIGGTSVRDIILSGGALAAKDWLGFTGDGKLYLALNNSASGNILSTRVFIDNTAWGHLVVAIDTEKVVAADRVKMYWNGVQITGFSPATYPALNYDFTDWNNAGATMMLGNSSVANLGYGGYMSHLYWIDGQQLDANSFGRLNTTTGQWVHRSYGGTYGTNGCHLRFGDSSTTAALGRDYSGVGNNFTANNLSVTTYTDSMFDNPVNTNFTTWDYNHPVVSTGRVITMGNLRESNAAALAGFVKSTFGMQSGKWYAEFQPVATGTASECMFGLVSSLAAYAAYPGSDAFGMAYRGSDGNKYTGGVAAAYGNTFTSGDTIGIAFDADNGKLFFSKNNVWQNTGDPVAGTNPAYSSISMDRAWHFASGSQAFIREAAANFGQYPFTYAPPAGFLPLNTMRIQAPAFQKPNIYVDAALHTGSALPVSVSSLAFSPNLAWIKNRSANVSHYLFDTERSGNIPIFADSINAEGAAIAGFSLTGNGFSMPANTTGISTTANNFFSWNFVKGTVPGFDIVKYTGDGTANRAVTHGLGGIPEFAFFKRRSGTGGWYLWHRDFGLLGAQNYFMRSDSTGGVTAASVTNTPFGTGLWSSTQFMVTNNATNNLNVSAADYIVYLWRSVPNVSSVYSVYGNGSVDGPLVYTGFSPRMYMYFSAAPGDNGAVMMDTVRAPTNKAYPFSYQFVNNAEFNLPGSYEWYILSNGFKIGLANATANWIGNRMYGIAFAEFPLRYARSR